MVVRVHGAFRLTHCEAWHQVFTHRYVLCSRCGFLAPLFQWFCVFCDRSGGARSMCMSTASCGVHSFGCFDAPGWLRCTWACICLKRQLVERWLCVFWCPTGMWGDRLPPPKSGGYFCVSRGFCGGRGIARLPSASQLPRVHLRCPCVLRRRKDCTQAFLLTYSRASGGRDGVRPLPEA